MIPKRPENATWTDEQWQAIYQSGSNIIVSAGAGSGKTAVLTERIIEKLKSGISISSLIVLTFTKAAAFEMKTRVRKKIKKEIEKGNEALKKELECLDQASITTFDSYSLSLVKQYHCLLGIAQNIEIADNVALSKIKKEIMDDVFAYFYEKKDPLFLNLLDTFTTKDDNTMKTICFRLNDALDTLAHKEAYLETYLDTYLKDSVIDSNIQNYEALLSQAKNQIQCLLSDLVDHSFHPLSIEYAEKTKEVLEPLFTCIHYNQYKEFLLSYHMPTFPRSKKIDEQELKEMKQVYDQIKEQLDSLKELCSYENAEAMKESIWKTKDTVSILLSIIQEYDKRLFQYKKTVNQYEFFDITRLAITLLEEHPEICDDLKQNVHEIMIDEYQDTNDIGDYFISLISNHNVYMVGDIKQSIYRFRNANPSIFMEKYQNYSHHIGGEKIDLNKNFRSRREVLDNINFLFEKIMDEEIGGADYNHGHAMVFGNLNYEGTGKTNQNYQMEILDYEYKKTELSKKYRTEEIEAFVIACDIKKKVESHYQVYDKDKSVLRDICYQDFSILLDRKTSFDLYKKIFTYLGIPITLHKDESFVYSDEIFIVQNILKWIYCCLDSRYAQDYLRYVVMSVGRSAVGNIKDQDLFLLLMDHKVDLMKELQNINCPVYELNLKMMTLAEFSKTHTLSQLLNEIYATFDFYHAMLSLQNIELLTIKLDYLLDVTRKLEKNGYQILNFISYLQDAIENKTDITFAMNQDTTQNSVNIMTIHKSKGLEYYICYYAGLQKKFSKADLKEKFLFDHKLGILVPYYEEGIRETFYKALMKEQYQKEDIAERLRVFYVALTRAKEKMILVTNLMDADSKEELDNRGIVNDYIRLHYHSFYDVLASLKSRLSFYSTPIALEEIPLTKAYEQLKENNYQVQDNNDFLEISYIDLDLVPETIEQKHFSNSELVIDSEEQEKLNLGIQLHECLEYIDYDDIESSFDKMHISSFEKNKIQHFLLQPFMKQLKHPEFYREFEFVDTQGLEERHGIIDLLVIDDDCAYVIDYKLKTIDKESYQAQVRGYMNVIQKRLKKPVKGILYSILEETYIEVKA